MAQLCGLFDNGLQDLIEVESGTRDRCERATEGCKSGGFSLLFCFDRTILKRGGRSTRSDPGQDLGPSAVIAIVGSTWAARASSTLRLSSPVALALGERPRRRHPARRGLAWIAQMSLTEIREVARWTGSGIVTRPSPVRALVHGVAGARFASIDLAKHRGRGYVPVIAGIASTTWVDDEGSALDMFNRIATAAIVTWTVFMALGIAAAATGIGQDCVALVGAAATACLAAATARGEVGLALLVILWAVGLVPLALAWLVSRPKASSRTRGRAA